MPQWIRITKSMLNVKTQINLFVNRNYPESRTRRINGTACAHIPRKRHICRNRNDFIFLLTIPTHFSTTITHRTPYKSPGVPHQCRAPPRPRTLTRDRGIQRSAINSPRVPGRRQTPLAPRFLEGVLSSLISPRLLCNCARALSLLPG